MKTSFLLPSFAAALLLSSCLMQAPDGQANAPLVGTASLEAQSATVADPDPIELARTSRRVKSQIIEHAGHTLSWNDVWGVPNWVAWELTNDETRAPYRKRNDDFEPDPDVTGTRVTTHDYTKSGYTRGHMAPSGDMRWSQEAMDHSYYTSNICPQNQGLNAGLWEEVESRSRSWARRYGRVWICCGPIVDDIHKSLRRKVAVPSSFFKVIVAEEDNRYHALGFVFPNDDCKGTIWQSTRSIDDIEQLTGHDFFYALPDDIEDRIESDNNTQFWRRRNR